MQELTLCRGVQSGPVVLALQCLCRLCCSCWPAAPLWVSQNTAVGLIADRLNSCMCCRRAACLSCCCSLRAAGVLHMLSLPLQLAARNLKGVRCTYCLVAASDSRRRCWQPPLRSGCCQQLEWQHLQTTLGGQYVAAAFEVCRSTVQPASFATFDHTAVTYVVRTTCVLLGVRSSLLASLWLLPAHCVLTARAAVLCAEAEVACQAACNKG
jgi:hypothetical protein